MRRNTMVQTLGCAPIGYNAIQNLIAALACAAAFTTTSKAKEVA